MQFRKFLGVLTLALLSVISLKAQEERGIFVEGVAALASEHTENYAILTPAVGYQFNDRWALGFKMGFETANHDYKYYTPFVRFSFLTGSAFRMFVEGKLNFASRQVDGGQCTYQEAGFSLGASYKVCPHLRVIAQYLFLGWSNDEDKYGAWLGKHSGFALDANVYRAQLGLQFMF